MPKIIFIHCQTFSRKRNRGNQYISQVIAEGLRSGDHHAHVAEPLPPVAIFGAPGSFLKLHEEHVKKRRTQVLTRGRITDRAIRQDRHTLFTIVTSYPVPFAEVKKSRAEHAQYRKWVDLTYSWVQSHYGAQLKTAFAHFDETYPHLHFWLLADNPGADATLLHPGKAAKIKAEQRLKADGMPPREAVKSGNHALKVAMRAWIDDYHRVVGVPCGMMRDGPKRRRLSRSQHLSEQAMVWHNKSLEADRIQLEQEIRSLSFAHGAATRKLDELNSKSTAILESQRRLDSTATEFLARAKKHHARMAVQTAQIHASAALFDAVIREIEERTLTFDPKLGWSARDPAPFQAAGAIWQKLMPTMRRLVELIQATDEGRGKVPTTCHQSQPCIG